MTNRPTNKPTTDMKGKWNVTLPTRILNQENLSELVEELRGLVFEPGQELCLLLLLLFPGGSQ